MSNFVGTRGFKFEVGVTVASHHTRDFSVRATLIIALHTVLLCTLMVLPDTYCIELVVKHLSLTWLWE